MDQPERVSDYPRPPALEPCTRRARVEIDGVTVADSTRALRVLETTHPPGIYIPPADVRRDLLRLSAGTTMCEWKGRAEYFEVGGRPRAAWHYPSPVPAYAALAEHVSFYPALMDACWLDDELVQPQPGRFYGGWITRDVVGPFKGI